MNRNEYFTLRGGEEKVFIDDLELPYSEELSAGGMHFHLWVPRDFPKEQVNKTMSKFASIMNRDRDVAGLSWDYLPKEYGGKG